MKRKGTPKPPFLKYRWPKGWRGKAIIGLLLLVSVPSVVLLVLLAKGFNNGGANLYFSGGSAGDTVDLGTCTGEDCHRLNEVLHAPEYFKVERCWHLIQRVHPDLPRVSDPPVPF
jgi:hypothetical protein